MIIKYIWKKDTNRLKPLFSKQKYFRSEKYIILKSQKWNRYNDNTMEAVLIKYSNKLKAFSLLRYQRDGEKFGWVKLSAFGAYFLKAKSVESLNYAYITIGWKVFKLAFKKKSWSFFVFLLYIYNFVIQRRSKVFLKKYEFIFEFKFECEFKKTLAPVSLV